jgi:UDP-N-acetyl-D-mannosaminuronate dehydrogenase
MVAQRFFIFMKKDGSKIGILGYGEVGEAIAQFYGSAGSPQAKIKDLKRDDGLKGVEILHICLPWKENFIEIVKKEIKEIKPKLTIIHSTVAIGTTKKIISGLPQDYQWVVHSPVRGIHPKLFEGIKTFVKYIGADNKKAGEMAKKHLESLGIKTKIFYPSITTEIGKLLDTSYYGLCIAWHGEMKKLCDKYKIDFEKAVTDFNKTYNEAYKKLGKPNVIRPALYPPKKGIDGHCIIENTEILKKYFKSKALDLILDYKSKKNK